MFNAILWDNDGVLVDTEHLYYKATQQVLSEIGVELSLSEFIDLFMVQNKGAMELVLEKGFSKEDYENLRKRRNILYGDMLRYEDITLPHVPEVLKSLLKQVRMAIVTSSRRDHFEIIHHKTKLLPFFEFSLASGDYPASKPDPSPYLCALDMLGLPPNEVLVIEDSRRGLLAAKGAGLKCAVIPNQYSIKSDLSEADWNLGSIENVPELVLNCKN
ncbi:MAG: HAD family phosphatase [Planctomycetes bacterium]|nr:HAD family phosphatase [Planctomycetota bacterium]